MIFSSKEYLIFFAIIMVAMALLKSAKLQKTVLLAASYYFYAYWDYRFVFLMLVMSGVNYYLGNKIYAGAGSGKKWLICGVIFNLVILGFFKYYNFFIDSLNILLGDNSALPLLNIILPVGISFITFEVISYLIDIYRGQNKPAGSFLELALLVAFFPHLIAGPILKPREFLPQLEKKIIMKWANIEQGIQVFLLGLVKKIVIADRLALFIDPVYRSPQDFTSLTVWAAAIAYAIQIYCDFSGYSDMAIGSAKCLGLIIPRNFNMPYLSSNITEFWRRWHISLSNWLKEYLYISLGGNRLGKARQYLNLLLVMLLGGLWHGANWNFVIWGGLHGAALCLHKVFARSKIALRAGTSFSKVLNWLLTFTFVCLAWVFFRTSNLAEALIIIKKMLFFNMEGIYWVATSLVLIIPVLCLAHVLAFRQGDYMYFDLGSFKGLFLLFFVILGVILTMPVNSSPFIYFQF